MKFRGERASVLWWIGIGLVVSMLWAGCGGDSSRTVPEVEDPQAPPVPSAPVATITQGFSVEDSLGNALRLVVNYTLQDEEEDLASVEVEYSLRTCTDLDFSPFLPAPEGVGSEGTTDLTTAATPPGQVHTFVMDAIAAGLSGAGPVDVQIRITPSDASAVGLPATSGLIHVGAASAMIVL